MQQRIGAAQRRIGAAQRRIVKISQGFSAIVILFVMAITNQFFLPSQSIISLTIAIAFLTNCSSKTPEKVPGQDHVMKFSENTATKSYRTATSSLDDLGLRKDEIPAPLLAALKNPYAGSAKMKCEDVRDEIAALDAILGPDIQPEKIDKTSSPLMVNADGVTFDADIINMNAITMDSINSHALKALNAGEDFAQDTLVGLIRVKTSFLPFRSIIRQITGANAHIKKTTRAQEAGKLRRAYLKGWGHASGHGKCIAPVIAPKPAIEEARADIKH